MPRKPHPLRWPDPQLVGGCAAGPQEQVCCPSSGAGDTPGRVAGNPEAVTEAAYSLSYIHSPPYPHTLLPSPSSATLGAETATPPAQMAWGGGALLSGGPIDPRHPRSSHSRPSHFFPACPRHLPGSPTQRGLNVPKSLRLTPPNLGCLVCLYTGQ